MELHLRTAVHAANDTPLRVEPNALTPGCSIWIGRADQGVCLYLPEAKAAQLRDALDLYLRAVAARA
jgi:hypothetical protein